MSVHKSKIAIISDSVFPYNKGGKETRIHALSTRLAKSGHDVTIYTMKWWATDEKTRVEDGVTLHAISPLYPLYHGERRSIREGILFGLACYRLLWKDFDVLDVDHMPYFPLFSVRLVSLLRRKPMIATWHEVWGLTYWRQYLGKPGLLAFMLERLTVMLPTRIIAVSEMTALRLLNNMNTSRDVMVVPNGIDMSAMKRVSAAAESSDVMYAGRLLEHKNVDVLLRAISLLKKTRPNITCFIMGDGPERKSLEKLSLKLGLASNVHFFGFFPEQSQVYAYMKSSKVFVLPSTREGFGISLLEANACGIPVVTIDHPANAAKDLVTSKTGRITKLTPTAVAEGIEELLTKPTDPKVVMSLANEYDWKHSAGLLAEVYAK